MTEIISAMITAGAMMVVQILITSRQNSLVLYRLEQLEQKQDKHNNLIERMTRVEDQVGNLSKGDWNANR